MKYCEDCTSATWCYDQGKCDRAKVEVSEAALESLKSMAQRLQNERDELLHFVEETSCFLQAYVDSSMSRNNAENLASELHLDAKRIIAKCTAEQ